ncbi:MAG: ribokinase [Saprospiraceae bacterium]|nr:ribokinase [Saprospiraceae bacterium]
MSKILVIGSSNTDMVVKTNRFPQPGETIIGGEFFMFPGGKGANQAVAAARLGGRVSFICKVGNDLFGTQAVEGFRRENIHTAFCFVDAEAASGVALITINQEGENEIVVASGANHTLTADDLDQADELFHSAEIILLQLEIPLVTVQHAIHKGHQGFKKIVLNPAPAQVLPTSAYSDLFLITPNETETGLLTGIEIGSIKDAEKAADVFLSRGVQNVLITLGPHGSFFKNAQESFHFPVEEVQAIDTTAAGDVFNGALSVALAENKSWKSTIEFASRAASISVTRLGAQASAPYLNEMV